jgi:hypothetical protein
MLYAHPQFNSSAPVGRTPAKAEGLVELEMSVEVTSEELELEKAVDDQR